MAKHELTEKQIAALQKLGVVPSKFYKTHIPVNNDNVFFHGFTNWKKLGIAIAVDVYTSGEGIKRKRYCFDAYLLHPWCNKAGRCQLSQRGNRLLIEGNTQHHS